MKRYSIILISCGVVLLVLALTMLIPNQTVQAQCKTPSTCKTCHEVQGQYPVNNSGIWHQDHIIIDACAECHGGSRLAPEMETAHIGITKDLTTQAGYCLACHCDDLEERFAPYAVEKQIGDLSFLADVKAAPSTVGAHPFNSGFLAPAPFGVNSPQAPLVESPAAETESKDQTANWLAGGFLVILLVSGGGAVLVNERKQQLKENKSGFLSWLWSRIRQENWSPYIAGIFLGLVGILSVLAANHLMTASGGIAVITSAIANALAPQALEKNIYFRFVMPPAFDWEVLILIGMFVGGFLASLSSGTFKLRWNQDPVWVKIFGTSRLKRFLIGFISAAIIQYGASIAGGCTSGLAISGGMLLAPSAFLFMAGMFISGIIVALIIYRRRY